MARIFDATNGTRPTGWAISRAGATATYHNSSGIITSAAANAERLDYDPTSLSLLGLLIEPGATKTMLHSAELDNAYFTISNVGTPTADATTAPDGNTTAELYTGTSSTSTPGHGVFKTFSGNTAGNSTFWEIWVKAGPTTPIKRLWVRDDQNAVASAVFDISTGTVVSGSVTGTGTVATIKAYPSGWYRLRIINPSGAMAFMGWSCVMMTDTASGFGDHLFDATGRTVYIWGAGFGQYTGLSYIGTTTASVARGADAYSYTVGAGVNQITVTFDDASTQLITGLTAGSTYTLPTNLNRSWIKYIDDGAGVVASPFLFRRQRVYLRR